MLRSNTNPSAACLIVNTNLSGLPPPRPHSQCCCSAHRYFKSHMGLSLLYRTQNSYLISPPCISFCAPVHFSWVRILPLKSCLGIYFIEHLCVIMYLHVSCLHVHLFCLIFENMTTWPIRLAWFSLFASAGPSVVPPHGGSLSSPWLLSESACPLLTEL